MLRNTHQLAVACLAVLTISGLSFAQSTTSPSSPLIQPQEAPMITADQVSGNNVGQQVDSLFQPKSDESYFMTIDKMDPAHIRADMPMQIGQYEDMHLYMGLDTVGRLQGITQENAYFPRGTQLENLNLGFQDPYANLNFLAQIPDKLDVYFDIYIASGPHATTTYAHEGYLLFKDWPSANGEDTILNKAFDYINVKVGAFDIDFGDQNYTRSNNARVQRNPLVGNAIVDPNVEEIGGEVYTIRGPVYGEIGITSGTTGGHLDEGTQPAFHAKLWTDPCPDLRLSVSGYYAYLNNRQDDSATETSDLYTAERSGEPYESVFGSPVADEPGNITPEAGNDVTAVQGDATWTHWPWEMYGNVGFTGETHSNGDILTGATAGPRPGPGELNERWMYAEAQPLFHITPAIYVVGRYSIAYSQAVNGVADHGWADRIQIGGGYWITKNILAKAEYVYQQYHAFSAADGIVSGVDAQKSPRFDGAIIEVSFQF
jgi:hypothetical protein